MKKLLLCLRDVPEALIPFINNKSACGATAWYNGIEIARIGKFGHHPNTATYHITTVKGQHRVDDALIEIMY